MTIRSLTINGVVILTAFIVGISITTLSMSSSMDITVLTIVSPLIIFFYLFPKFSVVLLLLSSMLSEFYWIEVMNGYLKPFHIISILLFIAYSLSNLKVLKQSRIFWLMIGFTFICFLSIGFSDDWRNSLRSFVLPLILFSISLNVSIALYNNKIEEQTFKNILVFGTLLTILLGLSQMIAYALSGTLLTLTKTQINQIIVAKRPPSFFTEADTFGKFLSFPFLFLMPFVLNNKRTSKWMKIFMVLLLLAVIVNMTRTVMLGIGFAGSIYIVYLFKQKKLAKGVAVAYGLITFFIIITPFLLITTRFLGSHEELSYRFKSLLNPTYAINEDASIIYRKRGVEETLKGSVESLKAFIIGHGWGSSLSSQRGKPLDVGGNLFINIVYYSGVFALLFFLSLSFRIVKVCLTVSRKEPRRDRRLFSEGVLFSFVGMLSISQLASMWIAPEFWSVIGCAIYLELVSRNINENSNNP